MSVCSLRSDLRHSVAGIEIMALSWILSKLQYSILSAIDTLYLAKSLPHAHVSYVLSAIGVWMKQLTRIVQSFEHRELDRRKHFTNSAARVALWLHSMKW